MRAVGEAPFVVVGGGPAGAYAARALAEHGLRVVVLTQEDEAPYDRTVLTKSALTGEGVVLPPLWIPGPWRDLVELRTGERVAAIRTGAHEVVTAGGEVAAYRKVLLATGAEPRTLPAWEGAVTIRAARDVRGLRRALARLRAEGRESARVLVVGGGVIGLETAASLRSLGHDVVVVEAGERILGRGVPASVAAWLHRLHEERGVEIRTRATAERGGFDVVVVGVGVAPRTGLAEAVGIACDDGILTDSSGRTSHRDVFAAGDCARWDGVRLESYIAAGEQGAVAGAAMAGEDASWRVMASNWSDQYDAILQSAGMPGADDEQISCEATDFVLVLSFDALDPGRLTGATGVARGPAAARPVRAVQRLLASRKPVDREALTGAGCDLRAITAVLTAAARAGES